MPRLPNSLLRKARNINSLLPALLGPCRDLTSAQNELRWLREHVHKEAKRRSKKGDTLAKADLLKTLVECRAKGFPLQYLLGSEFFGDLEIECRPGVLIPRPETAASVTHLAKLIGSAQNLPTELRVLDLCTGTGCIPLLFQNEFRSLRDNIALRLLGVDISRKAIALAIRNRRRLHQSNKDVYKTATAFMLADVLSNPFADSAIDSPLPLKSALNHRRLPAFWDILISNPPYISPDAFRTTTARSVRGFEPRLALVPPQEAGSSHVEKGDTFYPAIFQAAKDTEVKVVLLEVADLDQALRVARMAQMRNFDGVEIWCDQPDQVNDSIPEASHGIPIVGQGNGRSVVCWQGIGAEWLEKKAASIESRPMKEVLEQTLAPRFELERCADDTVRLPRFLFRARTQLVDEWGLPVKWSTQGDKKKS
ncbi:S-adenosyl-L-methionine-dependent methyltransferase [Pleomassaria siparia CBS 279.74]|uniref:S-adenosyl-L-methionine-dependent methyltransferase n=1 Tax=Pleomassaria siparia CBS 279.74 TaxID=1314801 RepID=A0A6G1KCW9_9PLEO|nr:S-adenosyl-L-methionine-dependent methyltransferase [Pleomassaria siparia CBS 279.74]